MKQNWEYKKLGDVCDIICGQDYKAVLDDNGKYPIYGTGGIMGYASEYRCPANSVIIGRKGSINNPLFVEREFWNVDTAFGMVPSKQFLNAKYFFYFCRNYDFTRHNVAVTIPSLRRIDLVKILVPIPPLAEQQRIVAELDLLTGIIDKQNAQLKELDTLAQSIFYDMFGDPIENPKGWDVKTIKEIGKVVTGNTPSRLVKEYYDKLYIEWIKSDNLSNDYLFASTAREYLSELGMSKARVLPIGSTLVTCIAGSLSTIGTASLVDRKVAFNQQINAIVPNENLVSDLFVLHTIRRIGKIIREHATNGMKHIITKAVFEKLPFILPPLALQQSFADKIQSIEKQKSTIKASIADTQKLLDYTMDKYFG